MAFHRPVELAPEFGVEGGRRRDLAECRKLLRLLAGSAIVLCFRFSLAAASGGVEDARTLLAGHLSHVILLLPSCKMPLRIKDNRGDFQCVLIDGVHKYVDQGRRGFLSLF